MIVSSRNFLIMLAGSKIFDKKNASTGEPRKEVTNVVISSNSLREFENGMEHEFQTLFSKRWETFRQLHIEWPNKWNEPSWKDLFSYKDGSFVVKKEKIDSLRYFYYEMDETYPLSCIRRASEYVKHIEVK